MAASCTLQAERNPTALSAPAMASLGAEAWAFWLLRWQRTRWAVRLVFRESRLRLALVVILSLVLWG